MNQYELTFVVRCPVDPKPVIHYRLSIRSDVMIEVEVLNAKVASLRNETRYHEYLAEELYVQFGGKQELVALHHGVKITTRRGYDV